MRLIKKEEYFQTVGVLAGMKEASETDRIYEGEELADEMMVFAGEMCIRDRSLHSHLQ